jgi:6-phosphogluconolactonase (cycloisomerase 2 family)
MFSSLLEHSEAGAAPMRGCRAIARIVAASVCAAGLSACGGGGGGGGDGTPPPTPSYSVGGSLSGLATGAAVTLTNNDTDALNVASNGSFKFATQLKAGTAYSVKVASEPSGQQCGVTNGSGSVAASDVTNVAIACTMMTAPTYSIGGSVSGLAPGTSVTLRDNGADALKVSANGAFAFTTKLKAGTAYSVSIATQPTGAQCSVTNGSGSVAASDVTNVGITCAPVGTPTYSVGGSVSGLSAGASVTLSDNGTDSLQVSGNGAFTLPIKLRSGALYSVSVTSQPTGEQCSVANGSGWIATSNVTNVAVSCTPLTTSTYSVGGSVGGLSNGASVTLTDNGTDSLKVAANGGFTFSTKLKSGSAYSVAVATQPTGELCSVANGSGTIVASNVTNVLVSCSPSATSASLLFVTNGTAGSIDGLSINTSTGVPTPISGSPFTDGPSPAAVAIDPQKRFLYVATGSGAIRGYVINSSTLKLSPISGSPFSTGANSIAIAVDPSGQFVLTANGGSDTVSVFKIASSGALTEVTGSPFTVGAGSDPSAIVVAAGQFVYTANPGKKTLSGFSMDSAGVLKTVPGSPFAVAGTPNGLVVDIYDTHVYATQSGPTAVSGFSIDGTGALTAISGSPYLATHAASLASPVMDAGGYRLHGADGTNVDCFQIEAGTGKLTELGLSYTNGKAVALVIDRPDNFLYALDNVNNQVEVFSIDPNSDGSLTLISGSPFALFPGAGSDSLGPNAIAVQH